MELIRVTNCQAEGRRQGRGIFPPQNETITAPWVILGFGFSKCQQQHERDQWFPDLRQSHGLKHQFCCHAVARVGSRTPNSQSEGECLVRSKLPTESQSYPPIFGWAAHTGQLGCWAVTPLHLNGSRRNVLQIEPTCSLGRRGGGAAPRQEDIKWVKLTSALEQPAAGYIIHLQLHCRTNRSLLRLHFLFFIWGLQGCRSQTLALLHCDMRWQPGLKFCCKAHAASELVNNETEKYVKKRSANPHFNSILYRLFNARRIDWLIVTMTPAPCYTCVWFIYWLNHSQ